MRYSEASTYGVAAYGKSRAVLANSSSLSARCRREEGVVGVLIQLNL